VNCSYHIGVELVPLPRATHRHFQTAADPDSVADLARIDLRCPVPRCPCVGSLFVNAANKKDCRRCGCPIEEWRSHMPNLCKACERAQQKFYNRRARGQRITSRARGAILIAQRAKGQEAAA